MADQGLDAVPAGGGLVISGASGAQAEAGDASGDEPDAGKAAGLRGPVCGPTPHGENGVVALSHGPGNLNIRGLRKQRFPQRFMPNERRRELWGKNWQDGLASPPRV